MENSRYKLQMQEARIRQLKDEKQSILIGRDKLLERANNTEVCNKEFEIRVTKILSEQQKDIEN